MATKTDNELNLAIRELGRKLGRVPTHEEREAERKRIEAEGGNNGCHAISQKDLFAMKVKPPAFLVEDLLVTPGLCLLGGKKKSNKSWLALDISQRVASGTPLLGREVKQGKVLYYALEDSFGRLKDRIMKMKTDPTLDVYYETSILPLNSPEGMADFEKAIRDQKPALTIIDTLSSATDKSLDENKASDTGDLMNHLRSLAIETDSCILILLHHGKKSFGDAGFDYRGSSAIPSASDVNISLYKSAEGHTLLAEGRDIIDTTLKLYFDKETWCFQLRGDNRSEHRAEIEDTIIEVVGELLNPDITTIAKELGISKPPTRGYLNQMVADKKLVSKQVKTGKTFKVTYSLPESEVTTITPFSVNTANVVNDINKENNNTDINEDNVINDVSNTLKVVTTLNESKNNDVSDVTPVSKVRKPKKVESLGIGENDTLSVDAIKNLSRITGEGLFDCVKGEGGCAVQSKYTKQPFTCSYMPGNKCPFWRPK